MENQCKLHHFPVIAKEILDKKNQGCPTAESQRLETIRTRQAEATADQQALDASSEASVIPVFRALDDPANLPLNDTCNFSEVYKEVAALIQLEQGFNFDYQPPFKLVFKFIGDWKAKKTIHGPRRGDTQEMYLKCPYLLLYQLRLEEKAAGEIVEDATFEQGHIPDFLMDYDQSKWDSLLHLVPWQ